jgi:hypothetical protein
MCTTGRIHINNSQLVYQIPFKMSTNIISLHRFTRVLRHKLEFRVLDLKESMIVERGGESFHKLGSSLSPCVWYIPTVILYFKLKRRLPPRTSVDGFLEFRLPRSHYGGSTTHEGEVSPMVMRDSATEH